MNQFISCDWGTSSFRMRLVDLNNLSIVAELVNSEGIAAFFQRWKQSGKPEHERIDFYSNFLDEQAAKLDLKGADASTLPMIISGMASSSMGMMEVPYTSLPFCTDGSDLKVERPGKGKLLISGACTHDDVLRGEETMLIGCDIKRSASLQLLIFPGTHSKHVEVQNGQAQTFRTYMTGEFFHLLSEKSVLSNSVAATHEHQFDHTSFKQGVKCGMEGNILHEAFKVRSRHVLGQTEPRSNYSFLSGLVIGTELREISSDRINQVVLVSSDKIRKQYTRAMEIVLPGMNLVHYDADLALLKGHQLLCNIYT